MGCKQLAVNVLVVVMATSVLTNPVRFGAQWEVKKSQATNRQKVQSQKSFSFSSGNQATYSVKKTQVSSINKKSESVKPPKFSAAAQGRSEAKFAGNKPQAARQTLVPQGNGFNSIQHATNENNINNVFGAQMNVGTIPTLQEFRHMANKVLVKKRIKLRNKVLNPPNGAFSLTRALKLKKSHKTNQKTNIVHDRDYLLNRKPKRKLSKIKFVKEKVRKGGRHTAKKHNRKPTSDNTIPKVKWTRIDRTQSNQANIKDKTVLVENQNRDNLPRLSSLGSRRYYIPFTGSQNANADRENRMSVDISLQDMSNEQWFAYKSSDIYDNQDFAKTEKPQIIVQTTETIPTVHPQLLDINVFKSAHNTGSQNISLVKLKKNRIKLGIQSPQSKNKARGDETLLKIPSPNPLLMSGAKSSLPITTRMLSLIRPSITLPDSEASDIYSKRNHFKEANSPVSARRHSVLNRPKTIINVSHKKNSNQTKTTNSNNGKSKQRLKKSFSIKKKSPAQNRYIHNKQRKMDKIKTHAKRLKLKIHKEKMVTIEPPSSLSQTNIPLSNINKTPLNENVLSNTVSNSVIRLKMKPSSHSKAFKESKIKKHTERLEILGEGKSRRFQRPTSLKLKFKSKLSNSRRRTSSTKSTSLKRKMNDSNKFHKTVAPIEKDIVKNAVTLNNTENPRKETTFRDSTNKKKPKPQKQSVRFSRPEYSVVNYDKKSKHLKPSSNMVPLSENVNSDVTVPKVFNDILLKSNFVKKDSPDNLVPLDQETGEFAPVALARHSKRKRGKKGKSKRKKTKRKRYRKKLKNEKAKVHIKINAADKNRTNKALSLHITKADKGKRMSIKKSEKIPELSKDAVTSVTPLTTLMQEIIAKDITKTKKKTEREHFTFHKKLTNQTSKLVTNTISRSVSNKFSPKHIGSAIKASQLNSFQRIPSLLQQNQSKNETVRLVGSLGKLPNERFNEHKKFMKEINRPNMALKSESKLLTRITENTFVKGFASSSSGGDDTSVNISTIKGNPMDVNTPYVTTSNNTVNNEKNTKANSKSTPSLKKKVVIGINLMRGKGLPTSRKPSGRRSFQQTLRAMAMRATVNPPMGSASTRTANAIASSKWANRMMAGAGVVSQAGSALATGQVLPINSVISNAELPVNSPAKGINAANNNVAAATAGATGSATSGNSGSWVTYKEPTHAALVENSGAVNPTGLKLKSPNSGLPGNKGSVRSGIVSKNTGSSGATISSHSVSRASTVSINSKTSQVNTATGAGGYSATKYVSFPSAASSSSQMSSSTGTVTYGPGMTSGGDFTSRVTKPARLGTTRTKSAFASSSATGLGSATGVPISALYSSGRGSQSEATLVIQSGLESLNSGSASSRNAPGANFNTVNKSGKTSVRTSSGASGMRGGSVAGSNSITVAKSKGPGTRAAGFSSGSSGSITNAGASSMMAASTGNAAIVSSSRSQSNNFRVAKSMGVSKFNSRVNVGKNAAGTSFGASASTKNAAISSTMAANSGSAATASRSQIKKIGAVKSKEVLNSNFGIGAGVNAAVTSLGASGSTENAAASSMMAKNTGNTATVSKSQRNNFGVAKSERVSKSNSETGAGANAAGFSFGASGSNKNAGASSTMAAGAEIAAAIPKPRSQGASLSKIKGNKASPSGSWTVTAQGTDNVRSKTKINSNSAAFSASSSVTEAQTGSFRQSPTGKTRIISANTRLSAAKITAPSSFSMRQSAASTNAQAQATGLSRAGDVNTGAPSSGTSLRSGKVSQSSSLRALSRTTNTAVPADVSSTISKGRKTASSAEKSVLVNGSKLSVSSSTKLQNNLSSASKTAPSTASNAKQTTLSRSTKETEKEKIDKEMMAKVEAAHASVNTPARANSNEATSQTRKPGGYYYVDAYGNYKYYDGPAVQQPLRKQYDYFYNTPSPPVYSAGDYNYGSSWDFASYPVYDYPVKQEKKKEEEES